MYQQSGMGAEYLQAALQIQELDNSTTLLLGAQGIQDLATSNDPRRLAAVWSLHAGVPIGIQPRSDGNWDIIVNGRRTEQGQTTAQVSERAQVAYSSAYREQQAAMAAEYNLLGYKSQLAIGEQAQKGQQELEQIVTKSQADMIGNLAVANVQGKNRIMEVLAGQGVKVTSGGDGIMYVNNERTGEVYAYNPGGFPTSIDGVETISYLQRVYNSNQQQE